VLKYNGWLKMKKIIWFILYFSLLVSNIYSQDKFDLDNKSLFGVNISSITNNSNFFIGGINLKINILEIFQDNIDLNLGYFLLPNSIFLSFSYETFNIKDGWNKYELNYKGLQIGIGFLHKIRLGYSQRFIMNIGIFFDNYLGNYEYINIDGLIKNDFFSSGFGGQIGLLYRITPNISFTTDFLLKGADNMIPVIQGSGSFDISNVGLLMGISYMIPWDNNKN
jgi:hypothetical protein